MARRVAHDRDDQVIRDEVLAAMRIRRRVNQRSLAAQLPHLSTSALNSRVSRMKKLVKDAQAQLEARRARYAAQQAVAAARPLQDNAQALAQAAQADARPATAAPQPTQGDTAQEEATVALAGTAFAVQQVDEDMATVDQDYAFDEDVEHQACDDDLGAAQDLMNFIRSSDATRSSQAHPGAAAGEDQSSVQDAEIQRLTAELVTERASTAQLVLEKHAEQEKASRAEGNSSAKDAEVQRLTAELAAERMKSAQLELEKQAEQEKASELKSQFEKEKASRAQENSSAKDAEIQRLAAELAAERAKSAKLESEKQAASRQATEGETRLILQSRTLQAAQADIAARDKKITDLEATLDHHKNTHSGTIKRAQETARVKLQENIKAANDEAARLRAQMCQMQHTQAAQVHELSKQVVDLKDEMRNACWVRDLHFHLTSIEEVLQGLVDLLSRWLQGVEMNCLYTMRGGTEISVLPAVRYIASAVALYYKYDFAQRDRFQGCMEQWRKDRNYFCHRHDTAELRGNALINAKYVHQKLDQFIQEVRELDDDGIDKLAYDALKDSGVNK